MYLRLKSLLKQIDREAWIRFFVALGGLSLAFVLALYSTIARESGSLKWTAILASSALLVAGIVAITTVPYLARKVALHRVREAFQYDVTREGAIYLVVTLVIGIAALNTGNNLLFIVVAAMLAAIVVSGVASAGVLRGLELDVSMPPHVFARTPVLARLVLRNTRRTAPSFSVNIVPPRERKPVKRLRWRRARLGFPFLRPPERQWFQMPDVAVEIVSEPVRHDGIFSGSVYFPFIAARKSASADVELDFVRRGRYTQDEFGASTRFPFSFLTKTRRLPSKQELIVYPSVEPTDEFFEVLPMITGEFETFVRGRGYDLYRIREHMPGDSARHVDWKATAKSGSLKVREFTREDERKLRIVFDNPAPGAVSEKAYEAAVDLTASLAWHFAADPAELSFAGPGCPGTSDVYEFLKYLALVQPRVGDSILRDLAASGDYNVIVTAQARGSIPTHLWASSYFVFMDP